MKMICWVKSIKRLKNNYKFLVHLSDLMQLKQLQKNTWRIRVKKIVKIYNKFHS